MIRFIEDQILRFITARCQHPGEMVAADILEGGVPGIAVLYCRRCGSIKTAWQADEAGRRFSYLANFWRLCERCKGKELRMAKLTDERLGEWLAGDPSPQVEAIITELLALRAATAWRPISEAYAAYGSGALRPCQVLLTQHKDDLHPVAAYLLDFTDCGSWYRAVEGPEDIAISGANEPLYRPPTHFRLLPEPPEKL